MRKPFSHLSINITTHSVSRMDVNMVAEQRSAASLVDALIPVIMEEIVKVVKIVLQEQISERIRKQIGDVYVSQVVEQVTEVPKTSSRDRTLQCTVEQILDVPMPEMGETVGGSAEDRFPGQNQAADCGAYH